MTASAPAATAALAVSARGVTRTFGSVRALDGLDLEVPRGAVYGLLGPNGAGKSTLLRILLGLLEPDSGELRVAGFDPVRDDIEVKRRTGFVADSPDFYEDLRVTEALAIAAHHRRGQWDARRAAELLDGFGVPPAARLRTLSKGQRVKVSLTMALAFGPDVLLLDEPLGGLDPMSRRQFIQGVLAEYQDGERTIIISSHLVNEIAGFADYAGILHNGRLLRSGPVAELLESLHRVTAQWADTAGPLPDLPGTLHRERRGHEASWTIEGPSRTELEAQLARSGLAEAQVDGLSLEDAFIELTTHAEARR